MTPKLSAEITAALAHAPNGIEAVNPDTNRVYLICDPLLQQQAKVILDQHAIAEGIRHMEEGNTRPLDEAFEDMRNDLGFSQR
jgi:hypothetical protein